VIGCGPKRQLSSETRERVKLLPTPTAQLVRAW
jgi:hypothetical protein